MTPWILLLCALQQPPAPDREPFRLMVPGFKIREIPVTLTNINNVGYDAAGRLYAAGYDGRVHVVRDTDGDGLEDAVTTFWEKTGDDYPLGIVVRKEGVYVMRRHAVVLHRDRDGDGVPDTAEEAASGWRSDTLDADPMLKHRRVDDALGLAIGADGTFYVSIGAADFSNAYLLDKPTKKTSSYRLDMPRGVVLKITPDGKSREILATGVRFIVSMQFNRHGDLFATDQEGATWLPNGNSFDELLHLQAGRHYGFPPRHPTHLPAVIDEPSVFDYGPQHQSTCGFRFNDGPARFGPEAWEGDALVTAMSRGKLFRTALAKTAAGYVARTDLIGCSTMLPVDCALSPRGDLVVACHSGAPDWGSGPKGQGKLFKISYTDAPQPVLAWPSSPTETTIAFDRALDPESLKGLSRQASIEGGRAVEAGDRFEAFRPGYEVVKRQQRAPRTPLAVHSAVLGAGQRSLQLRTAPRTASVRYAVTLPGSIDLAHDLTGVAAEWIGGDERWSGWLPHLDLAAARGLTRGSAEHDHLWSSIRRPGRLRLKGQLDLWQMLRPAIQEGGKIDYSLPPETVTVTFRSSKAVGIKTPARVEGSRIVAAVESPAWIPVEIELETGGAEPALDVSWSTNEDARSRALPLRRILMPWATPDSAPSEAAPTPEIAGGDWEAGRRIFFGDRAACSKCHTIRGEGAALAPNLTNLVHRDYATVMKDIVLPSAAINPDYLSYTLRLKSGDVLAGVAVDGTPERLSLGLAGGEKLVVERAKIESLVPSTISLMPEGLLKGLDATQVRDLMTFLLSQK